MMKESRDNCSTYLIRPCLYSSYKMKHSSVHDVVGDDGANLKFNSVQLFLRWRSAMNPSESVWANKTPGLTRKVEEFEDVVWSSSAAEPDNFSEVQVKLNRDSWVEVTTTMTNQLRTWTIQSRASATQRLQLQESSYDDVITRIFGPASRERFERHLGDYQDLLYLVS